jgi:hypothetical protein
LGLKTASCDVRCSWQWFPKPWKSTCEMVVCFSFPGKNQKQKQNKNRNFVIYSESICNQILFFLVLLQYCTPKPQMPLHSNSVLHQRLSPCTWISNVLSVLLWTNMEKEEAQFSLDCATRLSMWWESSGNRVFLTHRNREFKTLVLLLWFSLVCCRWIFMGQVRQGANRKTK